MFQEWCSKKSGEKILIPGHTLREPRYASAASPEAVNAITDEKPGAFCVAVGCAVRSGSGVVVSAGAGTPEPVSVGAGENRTIVRSGTGAVVMTVSVKDA